ncbi:MAG: PilT/PilU family type 4a pilus ATPase [Thermodesulfobacteriota bacterium]|nr:PilT/PilU family type 4a pilus ATPase [Thermodesulfobacteriota bacterium]
MEEVKMENEILDIVVDTMAKTDIMSSLSRTSLVQAAKRAVLQKYNSDETIIFAGEAADAFYIIVRGEAVVVHSHQFSRKPVELTTLKECSVIGEIGLILNQPRTATVKSVGETLILKLDKKLFNYMVRNISAFGIAISKNLAHRVDQLSSKMLLPRFEDDGEIPSLDVIKKIPMDFIIRHRVLPLDMKDNTLRIGFVDEPCSTIVSSLHQFLPGIELYLMSIGRDFFNRALRLQPGLDQWERLYDGDRGDIEEAEDFKESKVNSLLKRMVAEGASDLHLCANHPPFWRIDGEIFPIGNTKELGRDEVLELFNDVLSERNRSDFSQNHDTDFSYIIPKLGRFRVNLFRDDRGANAVLKYVPSTILPFKQIRMPSVIEEICKNSQGLILVSGPTGSGKSTTLASIVDYINKNRSCHIITLENPIEFIHNNIKSLIHQREIGSHIPNYPRGLQAALREDPDVIVVSELRNTETISMAIEAANTGHLVVGTLHTHTAISTITRIVDSFPMELQSTIRASLCETLKGVITQVLCKRIGGGRCAAFEILVIDTAVANLIREQKTNQIGSIMQTGKTKGNLLMNDSLAELVSSNTISYGEALSKSYDREGFARRLGKIYPDKSE